MVKVDSVFEYGVERPPISEGLRYSIVKEKVITSISCRR